MAASTKKKLGQSELRKLMRERLKDKEEKVNSPIARYNSLGQLSCTVCNLHIKNDNLWNSHILSRNHKENLEMLKRKKNLTDSNASVSRACEKRKVAESLPFDSKKIYIKDMSNNGEDGFHIPRVSEKTESSKLSILQGYSSSSDEEEEEDECKEKPLVAFKENASSTKSLPPDFFDGPSQPVTSTLKLISSPLEVQPVLTQKEEEKQVRISSVNTVEALPEGFFDDPVLDAKVRKVEYKNPMEEEWEKFKKTIAEESDVSQAIIEEDMEESKVEREIDEIDEQIHNWGRVEALQSKQEKIKQQDHTKKIKEDNSSSDELELEELFDWRAKGAWKK